MELQFALLSLWRHRVLLAIGLVASIAAGVVMHSHARASNAGVVATTRLVLDTPKSQLLEAAPRSTDSLPWRTQMLMDLLQSKESLDQLASGMGVPRDQVDVVNPTLADPPVAASIPAAAAKTSSLVFAPYVVTPYVPNPVLPLIVLAAAAPDAVQAKRLAASAVAVLTAQSTSPGRYSSGIITGTDSVYEPFDVTQVAPIRTTAVKVAAKPVLPIAAAAFVFISWCSAIIFVLAPLKRVRTRRRARALLAGIGDGGQRAA